MGHIVDRSKEFLVATDRAIVTMRRLMLEAINRVERGDDPPGNQPADHRGVRAFDDIVPPATTTPQMVANTVAKW
jgi:hypothetical protein